MKTVIEMAREAFDVAVDGRGRETFSGDSFGLERLAELVRADEREACAKVCDDAHELMNSTFQGVAAAIRARSNL